MADQPTTPPTEPAPLSRYELGEHLEAQAKKLQGVSRRHFVDQHSLCSSCKFSTITRQASQNTRRIHCGIFETRMPEDLAECTAYAAFGSLSLTQMVDIATLIDDRPDRYRGYL